jgi:hypothetical protein
MLDPGYIIQFAMLPAIPAWVAWVGLAVSAAATGVSMARSAIHQGAIADYQKKEGERARQLAALQIAMNAASAGSEIRAERARAMAAAAGEFQPITIESRNIQTAQNVMNRLRAENYGVSERARTVESAANMRAATAEARRDLAITQGAMQMGSTLISAYSLSPESTQTKFEIDPRITNLNLPELEPPRILGPSLGGFD